MLCIIGIVYLHHWVWLNAVFVLAILPVLELIFPRDERNIVEENTLPTFILFMHVICNGILLLAMLYLIKYHSLRFVEFFGLSLSIGINSAMSAVVIAHELIHKNNKVSQWCGNFLLFIAGNFYFREHHLLIHHAKVGTESDAATARLNEGLYAFVIRSIYQQINQAFAIHNKLKANAQIHSLNPIVKRFIYQLFMIIILYLFINKLAVGFWLINGFLAAFMLEYVNYIEHYGLQRQSERDKVRAEHSWNSNAIISRYMLVDLSRHSDHHLYPVKQFNTLDTIKNSPMLPGGYASMIWIAIFPILWKKVMNKRINEFNHEVSRDGNGSPQC